MGDSVDVDATLEAHAHPAQWAARFARDRPAEPGIVTRHNRNSDGGAVGD